jgi:hypothetical protein
VLFTNHPKAHMAAPQDKPAANPLDFTTGMVLPTLNEDGSRHWINPRPSSGKFLTRRRATAIGLIALFTMLPHVTINDKPAILLDLVTRRFTFFGLTLLPNDTLLLALFLVCTFLSIFFITAIFGRVWCGWACPQTVYMEFVYRPIQRFFEGTPGRANKGSFVGSSSSTSRTCSSPASSRTPSLPTSSESTSCASGSPSPRLNTRRPSSSCSLSSSR